MPLFYFDVREGGNSSLMMRGLNFETWTLPNERQQKLPQKWGATGSRAGTAAMSPSRSATSMGSGC